jgi:hypothetical protein
MELNFAHAYPETILQSLSIQGSISFSETNPETDD